MKAVKKRLLYNKWILTKLTDSVIVREYNRINVSYNYILYLIMILVVV